MTGVQAFCAVSIVVIFGFALIAPMFGAKSPEVSMVEIVKSIMLLLVGYFFGSSSSSAKKDDALNAIAMAPTPTPDPMPAVPTDPPKE
jgi:chromate transport protein ChrA